MKPTSLTVLLASLVLCGCGGKGPTVEVIKPTPAAGGAVLALAEPDLTDWPAWRGPNGSGIAQPQDLPETWSATENVIWSTPVPGRGHGSPSIRGNRIFVSTADESAQTQSVFCYARDTGEKLWDREIHQGHFDHIHAKNSHASGTPACDGERVFIAYLNEGQIKVTALDLDGKILWQKPAGEFQTVHGYAASPLLHGPHVIIIGDSNGPAFLAALHRETGEIAWRIGRPQGTSFSSPRLGHLAGKDQIIVSGGSKVISYDPATGDEIWSCRGTTDTTAGTIATAGDRVFASGGYPGSETLCIRADGKGDVSETHVAWRKAEKVYVPSLLVLNNLLFGVKDDGVAFCWEAETGKELWKERLGGAFSASPVAVNDTIYATNELGVTFVYKAGRKFELLAENDLGSGGFASPVICGGRIYLRTGDALVCIGKSAPDDSATEKTAP